MQRQTTHLQKIEEKLLITTTLLMSTPRHIEIIAMCNCLLPILNLYYVCLQKSEELVIFL